jgi:large subunit ribosomal protein L18
MEFKTKNEKRKQRHKRIRSKMSGTSDVPRLSVFISNRHLYAQLIDDTKNKTILSVSDLKSKKKLKMTVVAKELGELLAQRALEKKIEKIVFDRSGYKYHGRVKALAEGAREGGLRF